LYLFHLKIHVYCLCNSCHVYCDLLSLLDDEDDEDYDEQNGGNSLLGFMFGNVDNSGDLDADYLDKV
jgi:TATA box-binding protein binding